MQSSFYLYLMHHENGNAGLNKRETAHEVRGTSALSRPKRSGDRKFESCLSQCIELTSSSWLKHTVRAQTANSPQSP